MGKNKHKPSNRRARVPSIDHPGERDRAAMRFYEYAASSGLLARFKAVPPFPDSLGWPDSIREAMPFIDLVRPLPENLLWSASLPGFLDAVFTAGRAAATHFACQPGIREVLAQPAESQREIYLLFKLSLLPSGGEKQRETLRELAGLPSGDLAARMQTAANRMNDAKRLRALVPDPGGEVDVARGRAENGYQGCLVVNWLALGLWMAEPVDVGRWLTMPAAREDRLPLAGPFGPLPIPDAETVGGWISRLRLHRYQGKGRINYSQRYWSIVCDDALKREVETAKQENSC